MEEGEGEGEEGRGGGGAADLPLSTPQLFRI